MGLTLQKVLVRTLNKLEDSSFQRFIQKLSVWEVREEYKNIPKDELTGKDPEHVAGLINSYYRYAYGAEVTLSLLEDIGEKKVQEELQQDLSEVDVSGHGLGTAMFTDRVNYIDNHREDLIRKITDVDPVLRDLRDKSLLTEEQYKDVMEKRRSEEKMEALCDINSHWEDTGKYTAYTLLRKYNEKIIKDLEAEDRMRTNVQSCIRDKVNFVDNQQIFLIKKITSVNPVLRDLRDQGLLTEEQYNDVKKKRRSWEKMKDLCEIIRHWEDTRKYTAYTLLRKYNEEIIKDLEAEDKMRDYLSQHLRDRAHFVDRYRTQLINNIKEVKPVIDYLQSNHLLTDDAYQRLQAMTGPEEQMRFLYHIFWDQSDAVKDQFYISLWRYNYTVINNLEKCQKLGKLPKAGGHFMDRHKEDLISKIGNIHPVVNHLYHKAMLTRADGHYVMGIPEPEDRMRRLYDIISDWDDDDKEEVYRTLYKYNPNIIDDLNRMESADPFIDRHKEDLIKRIMNVLPVLEELHNKHLLTREQCDIIMGIMESEGRMRHLYDIISDWDDEDKKELYQIMYKHNPSVIRDLQMKSLAYILHSIGDELEAPLQWKEKINIIQPIYDLFLKSLLTREQCEEIIKIPDTENMERRLYDIISDWNDDDREEVYRTLYKQDPIGDLEIMEESLEKKISEMLGASNVEMKEDDVTCKLCNKLQDCVEVITPTIISSTYCLSMNSPGLFRCSQSGIQFRVTQPVTIEYEVDSWSNYLEILQNLRGGYEIIGPLFNIKSKLEPNVVSAVYIPHCLCIAGFTGDKSLIKCFHYKDDNLVLETPSRMEAMYAVLENPTFSCIGVILYPLNLLKEEIIKLIPYHGMALLFCKTIAREDLKHKYRLHLYLLPRICTVEKEVECFESRFLFQRIPKPAQTKALYSKKEYRIGVPLTARVLPNTLLFESHCPSEIYPFTEISMEGERSAEVNVAILPEDKDVKVWETVVSAEEMLDLQSAMSRLTIQPADSKLLAEQSDHFVDRNRADLIRMIAVVEPVLDDLLALELVTYEQYNTVLINSTNEEKMRKLYGFIRAWGNDDKDKVYQILRKHNHPIIKHLENEVPAGYHKPHTSTGIFNCNLC